MPASQSRPRCAACGARNRAVARFCSACGTTLAGLSDAAPDAAGERRQLTLMFCDLADSTRLSIEHDPEDLRQILLAYRETCIAAIESCGGTLAHYAGDGLLAYFGFPRANEDDAARAVRAGLAVLAGLRALNADRAQQGIEPLHARLGLHTGLAVVADLGRGNHVESRAVLGEAPNIAARLQQAAAPDQVVASEATRRLTEGQFRFQDLGPQHLKGLPNPILAHLVLGEIPLRSRFEARGAGTPFVNRVEEMDRLLGIWRSTVTRGVRPVVLEGEPGIGKSRLAHEFRLRADAAAGATVVLGCNERYRTSAFQPVIDWLRAQLGLQEESNAAAQRRRLERVLDQASLPRAVHLPALGGLLGLASTPEETELAASPRRRRRRTIDSLVSFVAAMARANPVLMLVEDIHWADDSTLSFLRVLAEHAAGALLMLLATTRTGASLPASLAQERIVLEKFSPGDARQLAQGLASGRVDAALLERIVARTDGIPLFVEEITRTAMDHVTPGNAGRGQAATDVPMTLRDSLMAQLDRLPEAKSVAQLAAVLGRTFRASVIEAVAVRRGGIQRAALDRALRVLVEARFLEPVGDAPDAYRFRHALIQETAYESLLRSRCRTYHLWVAEILREHFPDHAEAQPEVLAQHLAAADRPAEALLAWQAAAERAGRRSANVEAAEHYRKALALLPRLPATRTTTEAEVRLNVALAAQITITRGNAEQEVLLAFERAYAAAARLGDSGLLIRSLRGMMPFHLVRGDIGAGYRIGLQLMDLLGEESDAGQLIQAWRPFGLCLLYLGRFDEARHRLEAVLRLYDEEKHAGQRFEYGSDPAVLAHCHLAWAEWFLGRRDRSTAHMDASLAQASRLNHPHSMAFALAFKACLEQFEDRPAGARAAAEDLIRIAQPLDYAYWIAWGEILHGWAMARLGDTEAGERELRRGLEDYTATGAGFLRPYALHLLAEVIGPTRREEALGALEDALRGGEANQIGCWRAESLRLKAWLLAGERPELAAQHAREALDIARQQRAEPLIRRAAALLRRLDAGEFAATPGWRPGQPDDAAGDPPSPTERERQRE